MDCECQLRPAPPTLVVRLEGKLIPSYEIGHGSTEIVTRVNAKKWTTMGDLAQWMRENVGLDVDAEGNPIGYTIEKIDPADLLRMETESLDTFRSQHAKPAPDRNGFREIAGTTTRKNRDNH